MPTHAKPAILTTCLLALLICSCLVFKALFDARVQAPTGLSKCGSSKPELLNRCASRPGTGPSGTNTSERATPTARRASPSSPTAPAHTAKHQHPPQTSWNSHCRLWGSAHSTITKKKLCLAFIRIQAQFVYTSVATIFRYNLQCKHYNIY